MNFTIERAAFLTAAKRAAQLAPSASPLEVLKCALLEIDTGARCLHMTATNMEVIDEKGTFAGGVIAPGVDTSARALFSHATKLGAIDLVNPHTSIGRNTAQAMQVGIVYGEADRVDGLVNRMFEQLGYKAAVVATGGLARRVAPLSRTITHVNQDLTLEGLRLVYDNFMENDVTGLYGRPD